MIKYNLADTSKLAESFFITSTNLSLISPNDKPFYHLSEALLPVIFDILDRHGNAGYDSNVHQKTTASNDRRGFVNFI
jgi:hypothetical protein